MPRKGAITLTEPAAPLLAGAAALGAAAGAGAAALGAAPGAPVDAPSSTVTSYTLPLTVIV